MFACMSAIVHLSLAQLLSSHHRLQLMNVHTPKNYLFICRERNNAKYASLHSWYTSFHVAFTCALKVSMSFAQYCQLQPKDRVCPGVVNRRACNRSLLSMNVSCSAARTSVEKTYPHMIKDAKCHVHILVDKRFETNNEQSWTFEKRLVNGGGELDDDNLAYTPCKRVSAAKQTLSWRSRDEAKETRPSACLIA